MAAIDGIRILILHTQKCTVFALEATDTCVQMQKQVQNLMVKVKEINKKCSALLWIMKQTETE